MSWSEILLVDYIDIYEEQCDVYVHTKDKRMIVFKDVRTNAHLDDTGFYVDYLFLGKNMTAFVPRDDFSYMEYVCSPRQNITKKDFDELYSYLDEEVDYTPSEGLKEP